MHGLVLILSVVQAILVCTRATFFYVEADQLRLNVTSLPANNSTEEPTTHPTQNSTGHAIAAGADNCETPSFNETGGSRLHRYFYNASSGTCEEFIHYGEDELKHFLTFDQCLESCASDISDTGGKRLSGINSPECTLDAQLLGRCRLTADLRKITSCATVNLFGKRADCLEAGCCWHHSYKICYQYVARTVRGESCVGYSNKSQFYGVGSFRSLDRSPYGWIAYLTFSSPINGSFCIAKSKFQRRITVGQKLSKNLGFLLEDRDIVSPGQKVIFHFTGTYEGTNLDKEICVR